MIHKRVTLAAASGLTAVLALSACGSANSDTALNTAGGQAAADLSQAKPGAADEAPGGVADDLTAAEPGESEPSSDVTANSSTGDATGDVASEEGVPAEGEEVEGAAGVAGQTTDSLQSKATKAVGTIVVDGKGMTLYRFDKDTAKPAKSNCNGDCAEQWPPALTNGEDPELRGVDQSLVGQVKRDDGKLQLTLAGWPLYYYALDKKPGDWKGIGVGGVWWAIQPNGKKAEKCEPGSMGGGAAKDEAAKGEEAKGEEAKGEEAKDEAAGNY